MEMYVEHNFREKNNNNEFKKTRIKMKLTQNNCINLSVLIKNNQIQIVLSKRKINVEKRYLKKNGRTNGSNYRWMD